MSFEPIRNTHRAYDGAVFRKKKLKAQSVIICLATPKTKILCGMG
jgi:hypothetical protein